MSAKEKKSASIQFQESWEIVERPFGSTTPIIGPVIVRIRNAWNSVATKWYVRGVIEQQNRYNLLTLRRITSLYAQLARQDRDNSEIAHDLAELNALLKQINARLDELNDRLARHEEQEQ